MAAASPDCLAEPLESETPLFLLYAGGSAEKPKAVVHTTAGYNLFVKKTMEWVFDIRSDDVFWCTSDLGWISGHSYVVYGPLLAGATTLMVEGSPRWPDQGRYWDIIQRQRVTIFYTVPALVRSFIAWGDAWVDRHDLSSLRLLGTVGEGISPDAWTWFHRKIGGQRCPVLDTWCQAETGGIMLSPLPGAIPTKPGSCARPLPGVMPEIIGDDGKPVKPGRGGWLVFSKPWPGMIRGIWGDDEAYRQQCWSQVLGKYFSGDNARCDADGYYWILGRIDDVVNVAGHRLSTIEIESALTSHPAVAEAAAVGRPHGLKGEAVVVFVTLGSGFTASDELRQELKNHVREELGALAMPDDIHFVSALPKTRNGKVLRRRLRNLAAGRETAGGMMLPQLDG